MTFRSGAYGRGDECHIKETHTKMCAELKATQLMRVYVSMECEGNNW